MKAYLTEEGLAETTQATTSSFRRPLKVLQNFQLFQNFNMSSKASVASSLKTSINKQKKGELSTQLKESQNRNKPTNLASRKTVYERNSSRTSCKSPSYGKKSEAQSDLKYKKSESSDGSVASVGSLTSSPKWSHIKNKFESEESANCVKSAKVTSTVGAESKRSVQSNRTMKNTLSGSGENVSYIHKNKYLVARKDDKRNSMFVNKSETNSVSNSKLSTDKPRLNTSNAKSENLRSTSRSASPKNSSVNIPAIHSSNFFKNSSGSINLGLKSSHSSISGSPDSSLKNSRCSSPNTASSSSPTLKSCPSKSTLLSASLDKTVNNSPKTSVVTSKENTTSTIKNIHSNNISNLNSSTFSRRNSQDSKMNLYKGKQKFEDKPILSFSQVPQQSEKLNAAFVSRAGRKSIGSELERSLSASVNSDKAVKTTKSRVNTVTNGAINKASVSENVEKIKELTKNSQQGSKTVWVKDSAGNWTKKINTETKGVGNNKVASLRSKFIESSKESGKVGNSPLAKSSTTSSVPSTNAQNNRPIAKSSTTSSICDNLFLSDLNKKLIIPKNTVDKKVTSTDIEVFKKSSDKNESLVTSTDNGLKLNIVQRAVLSYEGSLALLSPETQKRLKLITEKVQAQTDDDKILRAKAKTNDAGNKLPEKNSDAEHLNKALKKSSEQSSTDDPVLPARNFLNRYHQMSKALVSKELNKETGEKNKNKIGIKSHDVKVFTSNALKDVKNSQSSTESINSLKKIDLNSNNKTGTKLTMNFKLPNGQADLKSNNQENDYVLQPNASFLWRHSERSERAPSELSKSSTASSVSLTSSDYRNYYDIDNYYSSLELEIEKGSENSDEHIYIDSQESNSSDQTYASSLSSAYQNVPKGRQQKVSGCFDEWSDVSDDCRKNSTSSNQSSTLKKRRNKRHSSQRDSSTNFPKFHNISEERRQYFNDTISFTDSSDTLINDEVGNESTFDVSDVNHLYEPVYECLGNYLLNQDEENDENRSISLSPDELENEDFMQCSITSLESTESTHQDKGEVSKSSKEADDKNAANKKGSNKISQLKRHLSWTKNDIRLELSSKFNKIKIKKNGRNTTEIGLKMQDSENANTSPKKKTFIKCILRQKSASSIPIKRSPSPKKESALFYVHLTMGREKQRPCSDSIVSGKPAEDSGEVILKPRNQSDSGVAYTSAIKCNQQNPRGRKFSSGHTIQRPKTPPPLPPVQSVLSNKSSVNGSPDEKTISTTTLVCDNDDLDSELYNVLDPEYISTETLKRPSYENEVLRFIHANGKSRTSDSTSVEINDESDARRNSIDSSRKLSNDLNLPLLQSFQTENLKSPFEEEPMYQFYQKDVQQRATLWYSVDGSESEFEDDTASRLSDPDYQNPKRPVLQSQLSAMDLVHGEGGQRRLWCEVPEVVESGILKNITPNDRKIQEAMFEVITSEASYLKSLNFLIEHFVQCTEFSGDYTVKHILDKRERHILFSDIQPVRDVSASLLADLEKRWMTYIVLSDICDILYHHASRYFSVYVKYCSNQLYQERLLRELKEKRPDFMSVLKRLESNPVCQGLNMHSFLMLPMQRITRLPLLIDAIFRRLTVDSSIYDSCKIALATVNKIVAECNEGACKMQRMEEMLVISQQIDFKSCKGLGLLSASRWLVKKGELLQLILDNTSRRAFGRRWCKVQLYLFLFTDMLVVTRKKSDDNYSVVDYCPRNMLQVMPVDENTPPLPARLPSSYRNVFQLIMLNNRDGKTVEMLLSCLLESDRTRWMNAVRPAKSENPDEKIYEEWDCPQVQCTHAYNAQQPDELSLEEADVVNVFKKMSDGWYEGERIRDGVRGWFPSSHSVEIINSHVRARNLHQRYRLLMLSQSYLEEQYKAQAQQAKK